MPETPKWGWQDNHPVVNVSYNDAVAYCNWLGEEYEEDFRLPTEAEWEFAARGGNKSRGYEYSGSDYMEHVGWYADNGGGQTHVVGQKKANELGLYDMSGNIWEWCRDWCHENYYGNSLNMNLSGRTWGSFRVLRGGAWYFMAFGCRVASRNYFTPALGSDNYGFRVVLSQLRWIWKALRSQS